VDDCRLFIVWKFFSLACVYIYTTREFYAMCRIWRNAILLNQSIDFVAVAAVAAPLPMARELVNEGGDNDTLLSRYVWIYATPCPSCPLKIVYQARVRPVAPPLLLHRVDQIIFSTSRYGSLFARRTDLAWRSRDIADILIKQIGYFNRVIDQ